MAQSPWACRPGPQPTPSTRIPGSSPRVSTRSRPGRVPWWRVGGTPDPGGQPGARTSGGSTGPVRQLSRYAVTSTPPTRCCCGSDGLGQRHSSVVGVMATIRSPYTFCTTGAGCHGAVPLPGAGRPTTGPCPSRSPRTRSPSSLRQLLPEREDRSGALAELALVRGLSHPGRTRRAGSSTSRGAGRGPLRHRRTPA
jgi:hypothetical protein